jgi:AraC-like DNA-binding protein
MVAKYRGFRVFDTLPEQSTGSRLVVADEVGAYAAALPGVRLDVVRTGVGFGPDVVRSLVTDDATIASAVIGFPTLDRADLADDLLVAALVTAAPPGSRWSEMDLEPGTVFLYGPGAEHIGISPAGTGFSLAFIELERIEQLVDRLQLPIRLPGRGSVEALDPTPSVRTLAATLSSRRDPVASEAFGSANALSALHAVTAVLSEDSRNVRGGVWNGIDNRQVVHVCVVYVDAIGRMPSMAELSMVAHVSERRLRDAFGDTMGVPPIKYFRYRLLTVARERLLTGCRECVSVSYVSMDLGFGHFGRFAARYEKLFGELPSETLHVVHSSAIRSGGAVVEGDRPLSGIPGGAGEHRVGHVAVGELRAGEIGSGEVGIGESGASSGDDSVGKVQNRTVAGITP